MKTLLSILFYGAIHTALLGQVVPAPDTFVKQTTVCQEKWELSERFIRVSHPAPIDLKEACEVLQKDNILIGNPSDQIKVKIGIDDQGAACILSIEDNFDMIQNMEIFEELLTTNKWPINFHMKRAVNYVFLINFTRTKSAIKYQTELIPFPN